jgi:hypothetical protein
MTDDLGGGSDTDFREQQPGDLVEHAASKVRFHLSSFILATPLLRISAAWGATVLGSGPPHVVACAGLQFLLRP